MHHSVKGYIAVAAAALGECSLSLGLVAVGLLFLGRRVLLGGLPLLHADEEIVDGVELGQRLQFGLALCGRVDLSAAPVMDLVSVPGKRRPLRLFEGESGLPFWLGKLISEGQIRPVKAVLALPEDGGYVGGIDPGEGALEEEGANCKLEWASRSGSQERYLRRLGVCGEVVEALASPLLFLLEELYGVLPHRGLGGLRLRLPVVVALALGGGRARRVGISRLLVVQETGDEGVSAPVVLGRLLPSIFRTDVREDCHHRHPEGRPLVTRGDRRVRLGLVKVPEGVVRVHCSALGCRRDQRVFSGRLVGLTEAALQGQGMG